MIKLIKVNEENNAIFKNVYPFYLYDLSEFVEDEELREDGTFSCDHVYDYYQTDHIFPYLIYNDEQLIGFTIITEPPYVKKGFDHAIVELFILRPHRHKGFGLTIIQELFKIHHGQTTLDVIPHNKSALYFWIRTLEKLNITYAESKKQDGNIELLTFDFNVT